MNNSGPGDNNMPGGPGGPPSGPPQGQGMGGRGMGNRGAGGFRGRGRGDFGRGDSRGGGFRGARGGGMDRGGRGGSRLVYSLFIIVFEFPCQHFTLLAKHLVNGVIIFNNSYPAVFPN